MSFVTLFSLKFNIIFWLWQKFLFATYIQDPDSFEKLDPDPHSPKNLDSEPDPHKVNEDPIRTLLKTNSKTQSNFI
jgi:hypothetical protein